MQNQINPNLKRLGKYKIQDNKVRIEYTDGSESVLFEDISSISYKSIKGFNWVAVNLSFFIGLGIYILLCFTVDSKGLSLVMNMLPMFVFPVITAYLFKNNYDNVNIETRGGKQIIFSVDFEKGEYYMEKIESDKRKFFK